MAIRSFTRRKPARRPLPAHLPRERIVYLQFNVGAAVSLPAIKNDLAERILPEEAVLRMVALEVGPRSSAILRLLHGAGLRRSELAGLSWRDVQERDKGADHGTRQGRQDSRRAALGCDLRRFHCPADRGCRPR